jgi:hypothetical protein
MTFSRGMYDEVNLYLSSYDVQTVSPLQAENNHTRPRMGTTKLLGFFNLYFTTMLVLCLTDSAVDIIQLMIAHFPPIPFHVTPLMQFLFFVLCVGGQFLYLYKILINTDSFISWYFNCLFSQEWKKMLKT